MDTLPVLLSDPRSELGDNALIEASHNGFPIVAGHAARRDRAGVIAGMGIALALGAMTFMLLGQSGHGDNTGEAQPQILTPQPLPEPGAPLAEAQQPAAQASIPAPTPAQQAMFAKAPTSAIQLNPGSAPVMVYDVSAAELTLPARAGTAGATPAVQAGAGLGENEAFGARVGNAGVDTASATRLADPTNTVTQGTLIPAILETAIDSDLPGYVRAVVSQDVRSFDGKRVLIPRSSRLIGQYKSGLAAGQTRALVMWTRLIRPDGASVALASPAVEFSGRSGLTGEVDQHFFRRFGSASLLSVIGGLGAIASGGAGLLITSGSTSAASVAAQRDAQIPPTIRVAQGQPIRVFTARDLDFSTVAP